jgi:thiamine kinase-like enzyme
LKFQSNNLYDVWIEKQHLIAKEYLRENERVGASEREYKALRLLEVSGIAPKPVFHDTSYEKPIVVYEFMEGEMWDRRRPSTEDLEKLLQVWKRVNSISADKQWFSKGSDRRVDEVGQEIYQRIKNYADWTAFEFEQGGVAAKKCLKIIEDRFSLLDEFASKKPVYRFSKSDPRFANVIQRPDGGLGLVDWEDSGMRDPARELADIITHPNQEDLLEWNDWRAFVAEYAAFLQKDDAEMLDRMHLYMAIFPIFWLSIITARGMKMMESGNIEYWKVNDIAVNIRLRRYLARAVAWPAYDFSQQLDEFSGIEFFPEDRGA